MVTVTKDRLSPIERQRRLDEAATKYMHGTLDINALEDAERSYGHDYRAATRALAQRRAQHDQSKKVRLAKSWWRRLLAI